MADLLKTNTTLTTVEYAASCPSPCCQHPLTRPFVHSTLLCSIGGNNLKVEGAAHVAEALKTNTTLTSVEYAPLALLPTVSTP